MPRFTKGFARPAGQASSLVGAALAAGLLLAASASAAVQQFGFNTYTSPQTIAAQKLLGAPTQRIFVAWSTVEPAPGLWSWQQSDQQYQAIVAGGLRPLIDVFAAPCWARPSTGCGAWYTGPPDPAYDPAWTDFVRRLSARYPKAIGVEIWNEPNLDVMFWPRADPVRYTKLLAEAYSAVKRTNRAMPVVSGGLAQSPLPGSVVGGEGDQPFLAAMYAAGARSSMDAIGAHPYPVAYNPDWTPRAWDPAAMEQMLQRLRAARAAAGGRQPIWITEVGESTTAQYAYPPPVGPAQQAADLLTMINSAEADSDVPVMIIQSLQDLAPWNVNAYNSILAGVGVFAWTWTPKPAACVLSHLWHGSLAC
jgi:hypothetical protein